MGETNEQTTERVNLYVASSSLMRKTNLYVLAEVSNLSEEARRSKIDLLQGNSGGILGRNKGNMTRAYRTYSLFYKAKPK